MLNLIIVPFIVIGLIQYRKNKSRKLLTIGIGIFISFMIYLVNLQIETINGLKAIDEQNKKRIEEYKKEIDSVKYFLPENEQMEIISAYSLLIAVNKYSVYGIKTNYYDKNGNIIQFKPSKKEIQTLSYRNNLYSGWYKLLLNPIITLFISITIGLLIPVKRKNIYENNT